MDRTPPPKQNLAMSQAPQPPSELTDAGWRARPTMLGLAVSLTLTVAAVIVALNLGAANAGSSIMLMFLVTVLVSAVGFGFWTGLASAGLAFLAYNFFFVEPIYTLRIHRSEDVFALIVFIAVAGLTGFLAGRLREEADAAKGRSAMLEVLSHFSADLNKAKSRDAILRAMLLRVAEAAQGDAYLMIPEQIGLRLTGASPEGQEPNDADLQAADRAVRFAARQEATAPGWAGSHFVFHPVVHSGAVIAVIGHRALPRALRDMAYREQAVQAIFRQGLIALDRTALSASADESRRKAERSMLRAALLSSVSHDLRTPLATILGSVTSLRELHDTLPPEAQSDLLVAIEEETGRMARHVDNLLQMTRLESGLTPQLDWVDLVEVAHAAIMRARRAFSEREITLSSPVEMPVIRSDAGLLEQVIFNLIDNAVKFSAGAVSVTCSKHGPALVLSVRDHGAGIAPRDLTQVFEPFYRGKASAPGTGLGLTICKGIVQALGGEIHVISPVDADLEDSSGTVARLILPLPEVAIS